MIDELLGHDVVFRLAWCLVSSLWQLTAIALVAAALRIVLPRTAQVRYWLAVAALAAMFVTPVLTFVAGTPSAAMNLAPLHVDAGGSVASITSMSMPASLSVPDWTGWLTLAWLAGVLVCSLRLLVGWTAARALLARPQLPVPASVR